MRAVPFENEVFAFVAEHAWTPDGGLRTDTSLVEDLALAGDDGDDLIQDFARTFEVDLTGYDPEAYFGPEGTGLLGLVLGPLLRALGATRSKVVPMRLTVGDLVAIAARRRWAEG